MFITVRLHEMIRRHNANAARKSFRNDWSTASDWIGSIVFAVCSAIGECLLFSTIALVIRTNDRARRVVVERLHGWLLAAPGRVLEPIVCGVEWSSLWSSRTDRRKHPASVERTAYNIIENTPAFRCLMRSCVFGSGAYVWFYCLNMCIENNSPFTARAAWKSWCVFCLGFACAIRSCRTLCVLYIFAMQYETRD